MRRRVMRFAQRNARADQTVSRKGMTSEIATRAAVGLDFGGMLESMPDPDPVLRKRGDDAQVLDDLATDDQVTMAMQQRKVGTLLRDQYRLAPGEAQGQEPDAEAVRLCDELSRDLENIDLFQLMSQVLDAPYFGHTIVEIIWEQAEGRLRVAGLVPKPRQWFGFYAREGAMTPGLLFKGMNGEVEVPEHKFVVARHFPSYLNPYGVRLLSRCLWPVSFKRGGVKFWMQFAERFGNPWTVGTAPQGADAALRRRMADDLARMVQDAVVVLPQGAEVVLKGVTGQGLTHERLVRYWDSSISKVIMGQTLTAELNSGGSLAAAETHRDILQDYRACDARMVKIFFEELAWSYCRVNGTPDVLTPTWEWIDETDEQALAEQDKRLWDVGVRFTEAYFQRRYGLAEDEFVVAGNDGTNGGGFVGADLRVRPDGGNFSIGVQRRRTREAIVEAAADREAGRAQGRFDALVDELAGIVEASESPEDLERRLMEAFPDFEDGELNEALHRAMVAAEMYGRWTARTSDGAGDA